MRGARHSSHRRGLRAETLAAWWLRLKGYRVLARRYRSPAGEIDLIVTRAGVVAAVEVKLRAGQDSAVEALTERQWQRIARAMEFWRRDNPRFLEHDFRFDALLLVPGRLPRHMPHIWWMDALDGS